MFPCCKSVAWCVHLRYCFTADTVPALTSNVSIVPLLDNFMSDLCYNSPCTNETLQSAASTVLAGCSSDLSGEGLSDSVVTTTFSAYPLVREVLCLKTSVSRSLVTDHT